MQLTAKRRSPRRKFDLIVAVCDITYLRMEYVHMPLAVTCLLRMRV